MSKRVKVPLALFLNQATVLSLEVADITSVSPSPSRSAANIGRTTAALPVASSITFCEPKLPEAGVGGRIVTGQSSTSPVVAVPPTPRVALVLIRTRAQDAPGSAQLG